mgnify:CR=1 FL=1
MGNMTKNFSREEFTCKCGCGFNIIDNDLVNIIQEIRDEVNEPIRINSGCRCAKHNQRVGGVRNSFHLQGKAADLSCKSGGRKIFDAINKLKGEGRLTGLKYYILYKTKNFVHVDVGRTRNNPYEIRG